MAVQFGRVRESVVVGLVRFLCVFAVFVAGLMSLQSYAMADATLYVSPKAVGKGTGLSPDSAAALADQSFWNLVREKLQTEAVTVLLKDGQYRDAVTVGTIGHEKNRLTIQAQNKGKAVFDKTGRFHLGGARNLTICDLEFTETDPKQDIYKLTIGQDRKTKTVSQDVLIQDCRFYDSLVYYGALGVHHGSHHVTVYRNTFQRIGQDSHAHMIYTAHDVKHLKVIGNTFEDCRGDYVRFRDECDFGEVRNNTFRSTDPEFNRPFVHMPIFNDVNPGDESHASHYLITGNQMTFESIKGRPSMRAAMGYHSSGFDPSHARFLPTAEEGKVLTSGTPEQKRQFFKDVMKIDLAQVRIDRNTIKNQSADFVYSVREAHGAKSLGWVGAASIGDAITSGPQMRGDVHVDGKLDERDVQYFHKALAARDEEAFLLDPEVWFGDYFAADMNSDGKIDQKDAQAFASLMKGKVPEASLRFKGR